MDNPKESIRTTTKLLEAQGLVKKTGSKLSLPADRREDLLVYARMFEDLFESYLVVLTTVRDVGKRMNRKDLVYEIRKNGIKMLSLGGIRLSESLSMPSYNHAIDRCIEQGILSADGESRKGDISLADAGVAERTSRRDQKVPFRSLRLRNRPRGQLDDFFDLFEQALFELFARFQKILELAMACVTDFNSDFTDSPGQHVMEQNRLFFVQIKIHGVLPGNWFTFRNH